MQPLGVAADADVRVEELAEAGFGEELRARTVADDAAVAHENDAVNLGEDVAEMMRDHDQARAFAGKAAEGFAEFALRGEVERVGRLVEEELARAMYEGAGDKDAALFAGGHGADELLGEMRGLDPLESFAGANAHFTGDVQIGPEGGCGKEARDDGVEAGGDGGALAGEFRAHGPGADDPEMTAEFREIPALAAEDANAHAGLNDGIELAGDGEDKRGLAAPIGAEDGDMLAGADGEVDVVEDDAFAPRDVDVAKVEEVGRTDLVLIHRQLPHWSHLLD